jgi:SAM-dependent methyltransferase
MSRYYRILVTFQVAVAVTVVQAKAQTYGPSCGMWWCKVHPVVRYNVPTTIPKTRYEIEPTPLEAIDKALQLVNPRDGETIYDFGCGDARFLKRAYTINKSLKLIGIEINPETVKVARSNIQDIQDIQGTIEIIEGDVTNININNINNKCIIYMYLYPEVIKNIPIETLLKARVVISYQHEIPQLKPYGIQPIKWSKGVFYISQQSQQR